ncbi:hypothetical protein M4D79_02500 [Mycolicibacterium novocastrense]|nr:hypothetical protein M4D79_02500 [Mycolicibacterium novocastrense]
MGRFRWFLLRERARRHRHRLRRVDRLLPAAVVAGWHQFLLVVVVAAGGGLVPYVPAGWW